MLLPPVYWAAEEVAAEDTAEDVPAVLEVPAALEVPPVVSFPQAAMVSAMTRAITARIAFFILSFPFSFWSAPQRSEAAPPENDAAVVVYAAKAGISFKRLSPRKGLARRSLLKEALIKVVPLKTAPYNGIESTAVLLQKRGTNFTVLLPLGSSIVNFCYNPVVSHKNRKQGAIF